VQAIRSIIPLDQILGEDVQNVGTLARDGIFAQWKVFPATDDVFAGAFDPTHAGWAVPGSDTWKFHLPADATPGTYRITMKGRRTYDGEDVAHTEFLEFQVGTNTPTAATIQTGNCGNCHVGGGALSKVLHENSNRSTCYACHAPLAVEYDSLISSRVHFLHTRSQRVDVNLKNCSTCHLTLQSIARTSKSACMACHTAATWPADHLANYGPVNSIFYGSDVDGFQQCTSTCHTNHPGSGL
jgi:predicted CXXCH cytochrome family protein